MLTDVHVENIKSKRTAHRFNKISTQICMLGAELTKLNNLFNMRIDLDEFCLINPDKNILKVFLAYRIFGYPLRYTQEEFCTLYDIVNLDAVLEKYESFEIDIVLKRLANFTLSEEAIDFTKAIRDTLLVIDDNNEPWAEIIRTGAIVYEYMRGHISLKRIILPYAMYTRMVQYAQMK